MPVIGRRAIKTCENTVTSRGRAVPRLSESYLFQAEYWWARGQTHSVWYYLMAAWFYEEEDEEIYQQARVNYATQTTLDLCANGDHGAHPRQVQAAATR